MEAVVLGVETLAVMVVPVVEVVALVGLLEVEALD